MTGVARLRGLAKALHNGGVVENCRRSKGGAVLFDLAAQSDVTPDDIEKNERVLVQLILVVPWRVPSKGELQNSIIALDDATEKSLSGISNKHRQSK